MPKKNKKPMPFMSFVKEYQRKDPKLKLEQAIAHCGPIWQGMSQQEKDVYKNKSKYTTLDLSNSNCKSEKYSSQGVPLSMIDNEKAEREKKEAKMLKEIAETVTRTRNVGTLGEQKYYFIMGNYFYHQMQGDIFYPAEIAICEYTLNTGVTKKYHSLLNPKSDIFGYTYEAQTHAKSTHALPLPPNDALGETNLGNVYLKLYEFLSSSGYSNVPPVYTHNKLIRIVESMLLYMKDQCDVDTGTIRVFSIQELFYELKKVTAEIGNTRKPNSIHITNAILDQDYYEHQSGIACEFHELMDRTKYCALSYAIRWAYTFSDNMCADLNIDMQPGYHVPLDIDITLVATNVDKSNYSGSTREFSSCNSEDPFNYESEEQNDSATSFESYPLEASANDNDENESYNPWAARSKIAVPPTDDEDFNYTGSLISRGRGKRLLQHNQTDTSLSNDSVSAHDSLFNNSSVSRRAMGRGNVFY